MDEASIRKKCDDYAFYSYGTTRIFQKREAKLKSRRVLITFLGIVVPVMLGATAAAFGAEWKWLPYVVTLAGVATIVQLYFSCWSIVARWDEQYASAVDSMLNNTTLYNKWNSLAGSSSTKLADEFEKTEEEYKRQELKDLAQSVTDKEIRYAAREAYKYFKKQCHICGEIPTTSKATKCDGCGNF